MIRVTGLCEGNSPVTREVPAQRASNKELFPFDDVIMWSRYISVKFWRTRGNYGLNNANYDRCDLILNRDYQFLVKTVDKKKEDFKT